MFKFSQPRAAVPHSSRGGSAKISLAITPLDLQPKPRLHFPPSHGRQAQSTAVEVLNQPFLFERHFEQCRTKRAGKMRTAFAPIETGTGKVAALLARGIQINAETGKRPDSFGSDVILLAIFSR